MREHGNVSTYKNGCRCDSCRAANTAYAKGRPTKEYDRQRYLREGERIRAANKAWRDANPDAEKARGKRNHDPARKAANLRRREAADPDGERAKRTERARLWRQSEKGKAIQLATRSQRRGAPLTKAAREYLPIIVTDPCSYCGGPGGTVDHIQPVARGGNGDWDNLAGACQPCNSSKNAKPLLLWMLQRAS